MYRQYASTFGRWTSPDPYGGSADVGDPQSLNRYAYAGNSPFVAADPSGLQQCVAANPITCIIPWPSPTGVDPGAVTGWLGFSEPDLGATAGGGLFSTLVNDAGSAFVFGDAFYNLGKDFGWWGGGPSFHGNVAASQTGKNVPATSSANIPGPPVDDSEAGNPYFQAAFGPGAAGYYGAGYKVVNGLGVATTAYVALPFAADLAVGGAESIGTAQIAVGPGFEASSGAHFAVGVEGEWMQGLAVGDEPMAMTGRLAQWFAGRATTTVFSVPVLFPEAVLPAEGELVGNCFTGVCGAIARGWGLWP
jgi:hypothetical protein